MRNVVLIAHGDPQVLETYCNALDAAGFNCLAAHTGGDALQTGLSYAPQFAVLQMELGEVQGTDVGLRLKQEERTSDIHIILLGKDHKEERFIGNEIGADVILTEPVQAADLVREMKSLHAKVARSLKA